jgi:hypothetical protein
MHVLGHLSVSRSLFLSRVPVARRTGRVVHARSDGQHVELLVPHSKVDSVIGHLHHRPAREHGHGYAWARMLHVAKRGQESETELKKLFAAYDLSPSNAGRDNHPPVSKPAKKKRQR